MFRFQRQKPKLSAREVNRWNRLADMVARGELSLQQNGQLPDPLNKPDQISGEWVWVYNNSDRDCRRYDAISLGDLMYSRTTSPGVFNLAEGPQFMYDMAVENRWRKTGVCLEAIGRQKIGRVQISGITKARVRTERFPQSVRRREYCYLSANSNSLLISESGNCRLLTSHPITSPNFTDVREVQLNVPANGVFSANYTLKDSANFLGSANAPLAGNYLNGRMLLSGSPLIGSECSDERYQYAGIRPETYNGTVQAHNLRFEWPGMYRFALQLEPLASTTADEFYVAQFQLYRTAGSSGALLQSTPFLKQRSILYYDDFVDIPAPCNVEVRCGVTYYPNPSTPTQRNVAGRVVFQMVHPRFPEVETGEDLDFDKWTYTSGLETIDGGAGPVS